MTPDTITSRRDLPIELPINKTFFCMFCRKATITKVKKENGTSVYLCESCGKESERFLAWDPGMEQYFNTNDELVHKSVGVVVQNSKNEVLLFKRVKFPFVWTIPAGHLDLGENPKRAAARELLEETQIVANNLDTLFVGEIKGDSCVGGADIHFWYAYLTTIPDHVEPTIDEDEGREWAWFSLDDLPEVTFPVDYLFKLQEVKKALLS